VVEGRGTRAPTPAHKTAMVPEDCGAGPGGLPPLPGCRRIGRQVTICKLKGQWSETIKYGTIVRMDRTGPLGAGLWQPVLVRFKKKGKLCERIFRDCDLLWGRFHFPQVPSSRNKNKVYCWQLAKKREWERVKTLIVLALAARGAGKQRGLLSRDGGLFRHLCEFVTWPKRA